MCVFFVVVCCLEWENVGMRRRFKIFKIGFVYVDLIVDFNVDDWMLVFIVCGDVRVS